MAKQKSLPDPVWPLKKKVFELKRNFYGCIKKALLTENDHKIMSAELRKAERALEEAQEQLKP
jgi:hypothetical protein